MTNKFGLNLERYSDFLIPRFFKPTIFFKHGMFPLDLLQSNSDCNFIPPIFRTLDFSKLLKSPMKEIYKKFNFDFSNPQESTTQ